MPASSRVGSLAFAVLPGKREARQTGSGSIFAKDASDQPDPVFLEATARVRGFFAEVVDEHAQAQLSGCCRGGVGRRPAQMDRAGAFEERFKHRLRLVAIGRLGGFRGGMDDVGERLWGSRELGAEFAGDERDETAGPGPLVV